MRILYVTLYYKPAYVYGGPVNSFSSLCEGMVQAGAQITVFTTNANRGVPLDVPLQQPVNVDGVTVWYFPLFYNGLGYFYSSSLANAAWMHVPEFDIVVIESLWGYGLIPCATACIRYHIPYVIPVRGQLNPWALANKGLKKSIYLKIIGLRFLNRAAGIHCTDQIEAEAIEKLGLRPPTFVVPNPTSTAKFTDAKKSAMMRRRFGISESANILLFLGRITRVKRPDIAVDVLGAINCLGIDSHLIIIGPDEDGKVPQLEAQARKLGCEEKLHFTGLLCGDEVIAALSESSLLLMPSEVQENFGMSALEALASGVPILASQGVPVGRWAQIYDAGRVVDCKKDTFQQAAIELLSNPKELKLMGQRGKQLARQQFDISVIAQQMIQQYQALLTTGRPLGFTQFDLN